MTQRLHFGAEGMKGQKALEILRDIIGQPMMEPEVAGTLIVRKLRELQGNLEFLSNMLAAVAFDHGMLLGLSSVLSHHGQCVPRFDGTPCDCGLDAFEAFLDMPRAELVERTAMLQQTNRIIAT